MARGIALRFFRLNWRHVLPDIFLMVMSLYASLYLRDDKAFTQFLPVLNQFLPLVIGIRFFTLVAGGVYDIIWRYISLADAIKLVKYNLLSAFIIITAVFSLKWGTLPRSLFFIDAFLITLLMGGARVLRRVIFESSSDKKRKRDGRRTIIYGAGVNGKTLASRLLTDANLGFQLIGFVDDDTTKVKRFVAGVRVLGSGESLGDLLTEMRIQELIVAATNLNPQRMREIVQMCAAIGVKVRTVTNLHHMGLDSEKFDVVRDVQLSDLLNRSPKMIDLDVVRELIRGKRVLVTGAGGSIGSELSRQILQCEPNKLLILDHSEYSLFEIDNELKARASENTNIVPVLADIKDFRVLESHFKEHVPELIFHAAAYKHVHLVESNPLAAILNNIEGTLNLLKLSEKYQVGSFVMISTDKAVNPGGVMGATKRACELLVSKYAKRLRSRYCSVRFGNVLGSSGSLIPILKKQIENNDPVTVTHQDMRRYFMLIPEAVSLVLNAAAIAESGDIAILKMGEPVYITEIAKNLIALMGKTEEQVPIVYTGIRPGEKMFEELYLCGHELKTNHPDILVLPHGDTVGEKQLSDNIIDNLVQQVLEKAQLGEIESVYLLNQLVQLVKPIAVDQLGNKNILAFKN